jgi:hypothetical protein
MAKSLELIRVKIAELEAKLTDLRIVERELVALEPELARAPGGAGRCLMGTGKPFQCKPRRYSVLAADRDWVRPRQIAMYLSKLVTPRSLPEIGRRFGGRDHTTVLHAVRKITSALFTNIYAQFRVSRAGNTDRPGEMLPRPIAAQSDGWMQVAFI